MGIVDKARNLMRTSLTRTHVGTLTIPFITGIYLIWGSAVTAQSIKAQTARKLDVYDDKIRSSEAEQAQLDNFHVSLNEEPNARAHIIAYGGKEDPPGKARRFALRARNYLVMSRGIVPSRIVTVVGGRRTEFAVELWLVPEGASPPVPTPTETEKDDPGDNLLFDSYNTGYDNFGNKSEDDDARLGGFAAALKKEPRSWGCVIAYAETGDDRMGMEWDAPGTALALARQVRRYLVQRSGLSASKVTAVDGGYSGRVVVLWLMRPRARFDKGPFVYSHRLKAHADGTLTVRNRASLDMCCKACVRDSIDVYMFRNAEKQHSRSGHRRVASTRSINSDRLKSRKD